MTADLSKLIATQQDARLAADRELRFRIAERAHCRTGWQVEIETDRRPLALLTDPQWDDMFWVSYAYTAASDIPAERAALDTIEFWTRYDLLYRSRDIDLVAPYAFAGLRGPSSGRISIRGLYLVPEFTRYERFLLWLRRRKSK
jgi:hypothetical protein